MAQYDESMIFMPLAEAQLFFGTGAAVHRIDIMVDDAARVAEWRDGILRAAGQGLRATDWQQMNSSLVGALQVERVAMFLILTLIILVAALNIISGLIMLVKDKSGDIAIMRTMGAGRGAIMRVFFIAGASVGVAGTILGFALAMLFVSNIDVVRQLLSSGSGFSNDVSFLAQIPAEVDWYEVLSVVVMALALSFLATLYPSWRAARLDPVEALRYE
jgi:lipoprotein-releasing system permease protein